MTDTPIGTEKRKRDPYLDRRSVDDRRMAYHLDYFMDGGLERRNAEERRTPKERRKNYLKVSKWTSVRLEEASRSPNRADRRHPPK